MRDVILESPSSQVLWVLDAGASPDEVTAVSQIARDEGLPGPVNATFSAKSIEDVPWWVILLVFSNFTLLKGFLNEAGRDSYKGLRRLMSRLFNARPNKQGKVHITVRRQFRTMIVFTYDLPEEAYSQLSEIDLENLESSSITGMSIRDVGDTGETVVNERVCPA